MNSNLLEAQKAADKFSWDEFIAINDRSPNSKGFRIFEEWKDVHEVYLPNGENPLPWKEHAEVVITDTNQAALEQDNLPGDLKDRRSHKIWYQTLMNEKVFEYVSCAGLYKSDRQASLDNINLPSGSMLLKAAWREITPSERSRFISKSAFIGIKTSGNRIAKRRTLLGLVGLHIVQKTPSAPQWIWSTFEHVDNLSGNHPNFCVAGSMKDANRQTTGSFPNRLQREERQFPNRDLDKLNERERREWKAKRSKLQFYELIGTQWPMPRFGDKTPPQNRILVHPAVLSNITMESFVQPTSTCMGCHASARTARMDKYVASDFTFTFAKAQPLLKNPNQLPEPTKPESDWDKENWDLIRRGLLLTTKTYEVLPTHVRAKLHCGSCHLDSGRNPDSSWWVGMIKKYEYPSTHKLFARINQCFERSMNGRPFPIADSEPVSAASDEIKAYIAYMQWLDEEYAKNHTEKPRSGFPAVEKITGEPLRGERIFRQKCAVCHQKEGEGRYRDNIYYRPALWGDRSFNTSAGLLAKPEKMAAFLKANMPFGFGGHLSAEESWDLVEFLKTKKRPAGPPIKPGS